MQIMIVIGGEVGGQIARLAREAAQFRRDGLSSWLTLLQPLTQLLLILCRETFDGGFDFGNRAHGRQDSTWRRLGSSGEIDRLAGASARPSPLLLQNSKV